MGRKKILSCAPHCAQSQENARSCHASHDQHHGSAWSLSFHLRCSTLEGRVLVSLLHSALRPELQHTTQKQIKRSSSPYNQP